MTHSKALDSTQRTLRAVSVGLALLTVAMIVGIIALQSGNCHVDRSTQDQLLEIIAGTAFMTVGLLITFTHPENRVGWILNMGGLGLVSDSLVANYVGCHLSGQLFLPGVPYMGWIGHRLVNWMIILPTFVFLPFLFPTGRFLSRRWRRLCIAGLALVSIVALITFFAPDLRMDNGMSGSYDLDSPLQWHGLSVEVYQFLFRLQSVLAISLSLAAIASMIARLRTSAGVEKLQMKWFVTFLAVAMSTQLLFFEIPLLVYADDLEATGLSPLFEAAYTAVLYLVFVGLPLMIGVAIFRFRLYEIDIIIRRTLIYSVVTLSLVAIYMGSVIVLQRLLTGVAGQQSPLAIVISTLLIAGLFNPLRKRVQRIIDRRFYRRKYDAAEVLHRFAQVARDEVDAHALSAEIETVIRETLQPQQIGLWINSSKRDR